MKQLKKISLYLVGGLLFLSLLIWITGNGYLFKGIKNTYLKGRTTPSISDITVFPTRKVNTPDSIFYWGNNPTTYQLSSKEKALFEDLETASFLVVKNDEIVFEKYWGEFHENFPTNSFSMAKSIISLLVGIALDEGKIKSLDTSIGAYLPEYKNSDITIRHLLWMSSGLDWTESAQNPFSDNAEAYYGDNLNALVLSQNHIQPPGKTFKYLSGNSQLLALILEKSTGHIVSNYAEEKIWKKIGARHPAFWSLDKTKGIEKAFCCLYAIPQDYAKIGRLLLNNGRLNGEQIISEDYLSEALFPNPTLEENGKKNKRYGMHFWMGEHQKERFFNLQGVYGQYVIVLPKSNIIIVRTGSKREKKDKTGLPKDLYKYIEIAKRM